MLKKEFKFMAPPALADEKADENGIKDSEVEFDWERDVAPQVRFHQSDMPFCSTVLIVDPLGEQKVKISWKSDKVNLTKIHPRLLDEDPETFELVEPGSIFNLFETESDPFEVCVFFLFLLSHLHLHTPFHIGLSACAIYLFLGCMTPLANANI